MAPPPHGQQHLEGGPQIPFQGDLCQSTGSPHSQGVGGHKTSPHAPVQTHPVASVHPGGPHLGHPHVEEGQIHRAGRYHARAPVDATAGTVLVGIPDSCTCSMTSSTKGAYPRRCSRASPCCSPKQRGTRKRGGTHVPLPSARGATTHQPTTRTQTHGTTRKRGTPRPAAAQRAPPDHQIHRHLPQLQPTAPLQYSMPPSTNQWGYTLTYHPPLRTGPLCQQANKQTPVPPCAEPPPQQQCEHGRPSTAASDSQHRGHGQSNPDTQYRNQR